MIPGFFVNIINIIIIPSLLLPTGFEYGHYDPRPFNAFDVVLNNTEIIPETDIVVHRRKLRLEDLLSKLLASIRFFLPSDPEYPAGSWPRTSCVCRNSA